MSFYILALDKPNLVEEKHCFKTMYVIIFVPHCFFIKMVYKLWLYDQDLQFYANLWSWKIMSKNKCPVCPTLGLEKVSVVHHIWYFLVHLLYNHTSCWKNGEDTSKSKLFSCVYVLNVLSVPLSCLSHLYRYMTLYASLKGIKVAYLWI